jgi:hypothetical protein
MCFAARNAKAAMVNVGLAVPPVGNVLLPTRYSKKETSVVNSDQQMIFQQQFKGRRESLRYIRRVKASKPAG